MKLTITQNGIEVYKGGYSPTDIDGLIRINNQFQKDGHVTLCSDAGQIKVVKENGPLTFRID